ncbi:MAG TPA: pentapeptide repeat-containing protein [Candidatus Paceibacterota bacterium]|jgi:hypothetical protein|nr:pentapeptide repeat-containing protein [Candidatus Paceibacterota bacterium]
MKITIKSQTGEVLYTCKAENIRDAVETAIKAGVKLVNANLRGTHLNGADLSGANLRGVNLSGTYLSGAIVEIVPRISVLELIIHGKRIGEGQIASALKQLR